MNMFGVGGSHTQTKIKACRSIIIYEGYLDKIATPDLELIWVCKCSGPGTSRWQHQPHIGALQVAEGLCKLTSCV